MQIKMRSLTKSFHKTDIQRWNNTSFWHDLWSNLRRLWYSDMMGENFHIDMRIPENVMVEEWTQRLRRQDILYMSWIVWKMSWRTIHYKLIREVSHEEPRKKESDSSSACSSTMDKEYVIFFLIYVMVDPVISDRNKFIYWYSVDISPNGHHTEVWTWEQKSWR